MGDRLAPLAGVIILISMSDEPEGGAPPEPPTRDERPKEVFKKGLGLLWQAARSAADEIKREVEKGGVTEALQQAGRDLEDAANQAAKALEGFIERAGGHPKPPYTEQWPPPGSEPPEKASDWPPPGSSTPSTAPEAGSAPEAAQPPQPEGAAPAAPEGGVDEDGERRDVRIQIEDD